MKASIPVHPALGVLVMVWWDIYLMMYVPPFLHAYVDKLKRERPRPME